MPHAASLESLPFHVELWDEADIHVEELLAACGNMIVAKAAYEAAVKMRPGKNLMLRHRARVIERAWG